MIVNENSLICYTFEELCSLVHTLLDNDKVVRIEECMGGEYLVTWGDLEKDE